MKLDTEDLIKMDLDEAAIDEVSGGVFPLIPLMALGVASAALGYQVGRDLAQN